MNLSESRIILTGAGGGIGSQLALQLSRKGAKLVLVDINEAKLNSLAAEIRGQGGTAIPVLADLSSPSGRGAVVEAALQALGGIDMLINNAGLLSFCEFSSQPQDGIEAMIQTNIAGPILLTRAVLPHFVQKNSGKIVNIGSTFGSIGFGYFSVYSATKFAIRGFSEALRRELDNTKIEVCYVAPRATRTPLNTNVVVQLNEKTGVAMDDPKDVAALIVVAIERDRKDCYIGWPEKFFARLNGLLPRMVDGALRKNNAVARDMVK
ncbi:MAG: SDR family oxidoreductase [Gallionellaceae bacterium]|nr:SDR family oxidoreductase [Gallionellaceae bacterium]